MKYVMGIDNGGTFSKAAVFDEKGRQLSAVSVPTRVITPKPGYMERDMEELWSVNVQAVSGALCRSGINPGDLVGVSFSGHGKGLYMVDERGEPVCNGILSTDTRAWEYVKRWDQEDVAGKVYERTYQRILACQPVSILAWMRDNAPETLRRAKHIFAVKDYIRFRMTGEAYAEYSDFSGGNLIDLRTGAYDKELLGMFGLEFVWDLLPPLRQSFEICGYVTEKAAMEMGLPAGIPVAAGMFDVDACGIASGLSDESRMCMVAGTWSINEYIRKEPITDKTVSLNSMFCIPGYYLVEESSPTSAGNMEWFIRRLMPDLCERGQDKGNPSVYETANRLVEHIDPRENRVIFLPFLNGSNEDALAKGTFVGLTSYHTREHMLRAVYEGVVFSHYTHIRKLLASRDVPTSVRLSGGAAKSDVWAQIFADVLQLPIDVIEDKELGAQGAAMAAGIAAGLYPDYETAVRETVKISRTIYPRREYAAIYKKKYEMYRAVIEGLSDVWSCFEDEDALSD